MIDNEPKCVRHLVSPPEGMVNVIKPVRNVYCAVEGCSAVGWAYVVVGQRNAEFFGPGTRGKTPHLSAQRAYQDYHEEPWR